MKDVPWTGGAMSALVIGTLIIPLVGLIAGISGLSVPQKNDQAKVLLGVAGFMCFVNFILLASEL